MGEQSRKDTHSVLIDEIQKAPNLLEHIKIICDESDARGWFWLTGSQGRKIMEKSQETLAGRLGILRLYGLSQREKAGVLDPAPLDFSMECLLKRKALLPDNDIVSVFDHIWKGGFADVQKATEEMSQTYYQSYIDNYLIADAVNDEGIKDIAGFKRFMRACAALVKNYTYARSSALLSFYRDDNAKEIDIFVEEDGLIHPLEIKKSANPEKKEVKKFSVIEKTSLSKGRGGIICMFPKPFPIDTDNSLIPSNLI